MLCGAFAWSETPLSVRPGGENTKIAPYYFGPNAFPVPDMLDGRAQHSLRAEVAADGYFGYQGDRTADVRLKVNIPLFTDRVNLTLWYPVYEWYQLTPERASTCRLSPYEERGSGAGDIYVSTDIWIVKARRWVPDIAARAALKTASGGNYERARHFDAPAYWFDLSSGKSLYLKRGVAFPFHEPDENAVEVRLSGTIGFLCWQTDNGRQNDAVYYGLQALVRYKYLSAQTTWSGYSGWEKDGDCPMVIRARLAGHVKGFEPFVQYQYGIRDYPFHQLRIGLAYHWDILQYKNRHKENKNR